MDNNIDKDEIVLYDANDIGRIFKIGRTQSYKLLNAKGFPSFKLNNKLYVSKDKLETWINRNTNRTFTY